MLRLNMALLLETCLGMRYSRLPPDQESFRMLYTCSLLCSHFAVLRAGPAHHVASAENARDPGLFGSQSLDFPVAGGPAGGRLAARPGHCFP